MVGEFLNGLEQNEHISFYLFPIIKASDTVLHMPGKTTKELKISNIADYSTAFLDKIGNNIEFVAGDIGESDSVVFTFSKQDIVGNCGDVTELSF